MLSLLHVGVYDLCTLVYSSLKFYKISTSDKIVMQLFHSVLNLRSSLSLSEITVQMDINNGSIIHMLLNVTGICYNAKGNFTTLIPSHINSIGHPWKSNINLLSLKVYRIEEEDLVGNVTSRVMLIMCLAGLQGVNYVTNSKSNEIILWV